MNTENSKTNQSSKILYEFTDKFNLKNPNKNMALANLSIYCTWKNIKSAYSNNKFTISAPSWNDEFNLLDGSHILHLIYKIILNIIKNHETIADNPPVQIHVYKIRNRIVFKIKKGYKLELLSPETMELLRSAKKDVDQDKDGENVPKLECVKVVLVHCNLVNNNYQQESIIYFCTK